MRKARVKPEREATETQRKTINIYIERSVPEKHKIATRRALLGQIPRSTAIRVKCLQCCNYEREQISECTVITCALWPVRPYQDKNTPVDVVEDESDEQDAE